MHAKHALYHLSYTPNWLTTTGQRDFFTQRFIKLLFLTNPNTKTKNSTTVGFEPTRAKPINLAGWRLNHSATLSHVSFHFIVCVRLSLVALLRLVSKRSAVSTPPVGCLFFWKHRHSSLGIEHSLSKRKRLSFFFFFFLSFLPKILNF